MREGDEILANGLGTDLSVDCINVRLKVDIEEIIGLIVVQDSEAGGVFSRDEERDGAADVRFELEIVAKAGVVEDFGLEIIAGHGG